MAVRAMLLPALGRQTEDPAEGTVGVQGQAGRDARTPLGRELQRIRARIVQSGEPLLDWAGVEAEVRARRGGLGAASEAHVP